jgi:hypothetical protein
MKLFKSTDDTMTDDATDDETSYDENGDTAMSVDTTPIDGDERPASTEVVSESEPAAEPTATYQDADTTYQDSDTAYQDADSGTDQPLPSFTPAAVGTTAAAGTANDTAVTSVQPDPADDGDEFSRPLTATTTAQDDTLTADEPLTAVPADDSPAALPVDEPVAAFTAAEPVAAFTADEPVAAFTADEPLLSDTAGMRASWQTVQAGFVDDPQAAVMDAADLIEQTVQSLVDALQQRQRQLRDTVAGDSAGYDSAAANGVPDTERLRLMMQRYRTLFNQLCNA